MRPAARLVHAEKRLENALPVCLRDAGTVVTDADLYIPVRLADRDAHRPVRPAVTDGVFGQVEQQPVQQRVAAGKHSAAVGLQHDALLLGKRREIGEDLLDHGRELDPVVTGHGAQLTHLQQDLRHLRHTLRLLLQQAQKRRRFGRDVRVLSGKQLKLRLHQRKRRAQLVRSVTRELPLRREARVQAVDHTVERAAEALKLRQHVLADLALRQIARLNAFHLRCKAAQRTQRAAADKIREHAAGEHDRRRDVPVRDAEGRLRAADDDRQLVIRTLALRVEGVGRTGLDLAVSRDAAADRVHVPLAGIADQAVHEHTRHADQRRRHQRDAPLQRQPLHVCASIT